MQQGSYEEEGVGWFSSLESLTLLAQSSLWIFAPLVTSTHSLHGSGLVRVSSVTDFNPVRKSFPWQPR